MEIVQQLTQDPAAFLGANGVAVLLALAFAAVVAAVFGAGMVVTGRPSYRKRLAGDVAVTAERPSLFFDESQSGLLRLFRPIYKDFIPTDEASVSNARLKMIQAGYFSPSAVSAFYGMKIVVAILVFAGLMLFLPILLRSFPPGSLFGLAAFGAGLGYVLPAWHVDYRRAKRQRLIREGFPDSLDLLLICVEAGLGLDAAISRVASELSLAHSILADHYRFVGAELRAGRSRHEALRGFSDRTGVDEVRSLVTLLIQSDELGTSISQALRVHAFEMRAKRLLRAEEKAHKIPVKLAFPLMFGLIPVIFMVTLTPAIIKFVTFIAPVLSRGMAGPG